MVGGVIRTGLSDLLGFSYMTICSAYRVRPEKGKNISSSSLGENALLMSEVIREAAAETTSVGEDHPAGLACH